MSTRADILAALGAADDEPVSGHDLAERFGISRNAVWKHVEALRQAGHDIESTHARGYRLLSSPDAITREALAARLQTKWMGRSLVCHGETGSTNDDASALAREGAVEGTVVVADAQSAGRGRLGRDWVSRPCLNLYASLVLRPRIVPASAPQLTLVAGVAVADALEREGVEARIKWPNDVLIDGRKVCGVLTEMEAEADMVGFVVVGIGVNLNSRLEDFPPQLRDKAVSVAMAEGRTVDRVGFAATLLGCFEEAYEEFCSGGFAPLRERWLAKSVLVGRRIEVAGPRGSVAGTCVGIDTDGALLLKREGTDDASQDASGDAPPERVVAGDVTVIGGYD